MKIFLTENNKECYKCNDITHPLQTILCRSCLEDMNENITKLLNPMIKTKDAETLASEIFEILNDELQAGDGYSICGMDEAHLKVKILLQRSYDEKIS